MKEITLNLDYVALISDEDYERVVEAGPWSTKVSHGVPMYARRSIRKPDGIRTKQSLHRFILGLTDPRILVDHKNRYGLDNRRENLRLATVSQNGANAHKHRDGTTSRFKGVSWHRRDRKWRAQIGFEGHRVALGYFTDELSAARAYDVAARKHFGEFAKCNLGKAA